MKERKVQTVKSHVHCAVTKRIERLQRCKTCMYRFKFEGGTRCGHKEKDGLPNDR